MFRPCGVAAIYALRNATALILVTCLSLVGELHIAVPGVGASVTLILSNGFRCRGHSADLLRNHRHCEPQGMPRPLQGYRGIGET
jgi:hypothetical protein